MSNSDLGTDFDTLYKKLRKFQRSWERVLFQRVARYLGGHPVEVHFQQPYLKERFGQVSKAPSGKAIIQIRPGLSDEQTLEIFLHEVAHVKLDFDNFQESLVHKLAPASWKITNRQAHDAETAPRETPVKTQARIWLGYLNTKVPQGSLAQKLTALLEYPQ